jgi:hypothetical protein
MRAGSGQTVFNDILSTQTMIRLEYGNYNVRILNIEENKKIDFSLVIDSNTDSRLNIMYSPDWDNMDSG